MSGKEREGEIRRGKRRLVEGKRGKKR